MAARLLHLSRHLPIRRPPALPAGASTVTARRFSSSQADVDWPHVTEMAGVGMTAFSSIVFYGIYKDDQRDIRLRAAAKKDYEDEISDLDEEIERIELRQLEKGKKK